ncbi:hypothetical protein E3N88_12712 [Mikania micrantha]|uniref:Uncharacterized protein n=1 Tax=Mikania micrantha TaxID=192012 RepID=A0A5N6P6Q9_9ASTR|nr:hypothetical protein E3N88_12712 [Mikania micrantha]
MPLRRRVNGANGHHEPTLVEGDKDEMSLQVVFSRSLRLRAVWRSKTRWIEAKSVEISLEEIEGGFCRR